MTDHPFLRRLARTATLAAVRATATTLGTAAGTATITLITWWLTHK